MNKSTPVVEMAMDFIFTASYPDAEQIERDAAAIMQALVFRIHELEIEKKALLHATDRVLAENAATRRLLRMPL